MRSITRDELLAGHAEPVRVLCETLRGFVHATIDGLEERVNAGWHSIGFIDREGGYVFALFPFEDRVHLLFEHGHRLHDPDRLLDGADKRQVRWVVLRPGQRLPRTRLQRLLLAAVHEARSRRASRAAARKRRPPRR